MTFLFFSLWIYILFEQTFDLNRSMEAQEVCYISDHAHLKKKKGFQFGSAFCYCRQQWGCFVRIFLKFEFGHVFQFRSLLSSVSQIDSVQQCCQQLENKFTKIDNKRDCLSRAGAQFILSSYVFLLLSHFACNYSPAASLIISQMFAFSLSILNTIVLIASIRKFLRSLNKFDYSLLCAKFLTL